MEVRRRSTPFDPNVTSDAATLRPRWHPLTDADSYNLDVRLAAHGRSGAYAIKHRATGRVLYVGESHTGRLWKTMIRHVQPGSRATCHKRDRKRKGGCLLFVDMREWVYNGSPADLDVALWIAPAAEAQDLEGELIERLDPLHNERGYDEPEDETPF